VETQTRQRPPEINAVLNLGEEASIWAKSAEPNADDRWVNKGEGKEGMTIPEIRGEANWVIERLKAGKTVLVHCVAGMNRSAAICCATVMLTEGLAAEEALARVREHHPWSRPDPNHWLKLRWLAQTAKR
jgi:UDP-N-acetylmuramyl pentapeptide synthase